jgi:hypothetical protein
VIHLLNMGEMRNICNSLTGEKWPLARCMRR